MGLLRRLVPHKNRWDCFAHLRRARNDRRSKAGAQWFLVWIIRAKSPLFSLYKSGYKIVVAQFIGHCPINRTTTFILIMKFLIIEKKRTTIKVVPTKTLEWHHLWCH